MGGTTVEIIKGTLVYVAATLWHNAPYLVLGILVASAISVYTDPDKLREWLLARSKVSIPGSVAFGAFTPF
jgi:uncharacterized protein